MAMSDYSFSLKMGMGLEHDCLYYHVQMYLFCELGTLDKIE